MMKKNKQMNLIMTSIALIALLLCGYVFAHGFAMLSGDEARLLRYQNVVAKESKEIISPNVKLSFRVVGILFTISGFLFLASFVKREFRSMDNAALLKWALFSAILAGTVYGGIMRVVSNQQGAALLFFLTILLFLILGIIEEKSARTRTFFSSIKLMPVYAVLLYTMGMPGWAKIFGGRQVIDRYVNMFKDSFVAVLPGGTPLIIYLLGVLELAVPVLLIISLIKGEPLTSEPKPWLNYALILSIFTFSMLCFGLAILFNFAGSTNLVFYPIFTLLVLAYLNPKHDQLVSDNI